MRWSYLAAAAVVVSLPWACGGKSVIDGQAGTGAGGSGNNVNTGGSSVGGGSNPVGPSGPVTVQASVGPVPPLCEVPTLSYECNECAFNFCQSELSQCCDAIGCIDLVACVADFCTGAADQQACAIANCPDEVSEAASAGTINQAQDLGSCVASCGCG